VKRYIRYVVKQIPNLDLLPYAAQSSLYFKENEKKLAEAAAQRNNTTVIDLFKKRW